MRWSFLGWLPFIVLGLAWCLTDGGDGAMRRLRDHGLALVFGGLLLLALVGQALCGLAGVNGDARDHGCRPSRSASTSRPRTSPSTSRRTGSRSTSSSSSTSCSPCGSSRRGRRSPSRLTRPAARATRSRRSAASPSPTRRVGQRSTGGAAALLALARADDGAIFLGSWSAQFIAGSAALQRRPDPRPQGAAGLGRLPRGPGLLEPHPAELAVGVPRRGDHGGASRSTCASVGRRSPSRWARPTRSTGVEG